MYILIAGKQEIPEGSAILLATTEAMQEIHAALKYYYNNTNVPHGTNPVLEELIGTYDNKMRREQHELEQGDFEQDERNW